MRSSSRLILEGFSVSKIKKCIPRKWREGFVGEVLPPNQQSKLQNSEKAVLESSRTYDESMIENLVASLGEYAAQGHLSSAFRVFSVIRHHASYTSFIDFISYPVAELLSCCTKLKSLPQGKQIHAQIVLLGLEQSSFLVPRLVTFYTKFDLLGDAQIVTRNSSVVNPLPWNVLITSYVRNELFSDALHAYKDMLSKGIQPDNFTYPSVLKACGETTDLEMGKMVHNSISDNCQDWNLFVHNALISMYGKFGQVDMARSLFEKMPERDDISWNTIISCYASRSLWNEAFELFEKMQAVGVQVNTITYNTVAGGCLRTGNFIRALQLVSQMRAFGLCMDSIAVITGLGACSHIGAIQLGKEIHAFSIRNCYDGFENVKNALITMYARCKDLCRAYYLFQSVEAKSITTWNSMLSGYAHTDQSEEATFLFREMLFSGIEPNHVTIASVLPLCARAANLQHGKEFHCFLTRRKEVFKDYLVPWNSLVAMYARSGKVREARRVFNSMKTRDEVTYTSLIAGYGVEGEGKTALKLFDEMLERQIKPDSLTFVSVLSACSHSGLVSEGQKWFEKMQSVHGIIPKTEHYSCIVDLYGRAGMLRKAMETILRMPYKPTSAMWATLLGACRIHGYMEIGEWAAGKLLETKSNNPGYYVLIANMYAAAGCWDKLAHVRTLMRDLGVRKAPGCAWVDVGSKFRPFVVDDTSNPHREEVYALLDGLTEVMKDVAYVSGEELGVEDDFF